MSFNAAWTRKLRLNIHSCGKMLMLHWFPVNKIKKQKAAKAEGLFKQVYDYIQKLLTITTCGAENS